MEKGEVGILAVQFGALIFAVLLLSNFAYGTNASSTPAITTVYWGSPPPASGISIGTGTNIEKTNASAVSFFYTLAYSTHLVAAAASRFCINPETNATVGGGETVYTNIPNLYSTAKKAYYFTFSLTGQPTGWNCVYSITITDSLQQMANWAGTVIVKPPPGGLN